MTNYDSPAAAEALAAMPAMFAALRESIYLDADDPRRAAAIAEKHRVLALIAAAEVAR